MPNLLIVVDIISRITGSSLPTYTGPSRPIHHNDRNEDSLEFQILDNKVNLTSA